MQYAVLTTGKALSEDFYAHLRDTMVQQKKITSTTLINLPNHKMMWLVVLEIMTVHSLYAVMELQHLIQKILGRNNLKTSKLH